MVDGLTNGSASDIAGSSIGEAAGLPDAAFDVLGAVAQMAVAGVDLAPGVEDADHRFAGPIVAVVAKLP